MKIKETLAIIIIGLYISGCTNSVKKKVESQAYFSKIYQTEKNQFGYDIFKDSVLVIHQPTIPSVEGNNGFSSKEDAKKVAELIIYKLSNGIMPPSVTPEELDSLILKIN